MIEVYELLRSKENELARVRTEIEALQVDDIPGLQPGPDPHASPVPQQKYLPHGVVLGCWCDQVKSTGPVEYCSRTIRSVVAFDPHLTPPHL